MIQVHELVKSPLADVQALEKGGSPRTVTRVLETVQSPPHADACALEEMSFPQRVALVLEAKMPMRRVLDRCRMASRNPPKSALQRLRVALHPPDPYHMHILESAFNFLLANVTRVPNWSEQYKDGSFCCRNMYCDLSTRTNLGQVTEIYVPDILVFKRWST